MNLPPIKISLRGRSLTEDPLLNKGTAFSDEEKALFGLEHILPRGYIPLEEQYRKCYEEYRKLSSDIERYIYLLELQNENETVFYRLLTRHLEEMLPIVYTPTVAEGCLRFSKIYKKPRGLFFSFRKKPSAIDIMEDPRRDKVRIIVVTDGERVLSLGDRGAEGMAIANGKAILYTALGGVPPEAVLPVVLDVGTDSEALLSDPLYIGLRQRRIRGEEYDDFLETFIQAIEKRFPNVLLQWEDFSKYNAARIADRYKERILSFNDDIEGTAAVVLAAVLSASRRTGTPVQDQKILILGSGSAGSGIASLFAHRLRNQGFSAAESVSNLYLCDSKGLLVAERSDLLPFQRPFAKPDLLALQTAKLPELIRKIRPTILIGASGQKGLFSEEAVKEMGKYVRHPVFFPLSNPGSQSEADPKDLLLWSEGRAILGTGSPFPPFFYNGKTVIPDQINNAWVFPGLGLAIVTANIRKIVPELFIAAAEALSSSENDPDRLFPPIIRARETAFTVAKAVVEEAVRHNLADSCSDWESKLRKAMWQPVYRTYER